MRKEEMVGSGDREFYYGDLVYLVAFMATQGYSAREVALAVERPWEYMKLIQFENEFIAA